MTTLAISENFPKAPTEVARQFIAEWTFGLRTVCLFQEPNCLAFSTDGRSGKTTTFKPALYDINYAVNLIKMFHRTIGVNLENDEPHSSCFLPKLCTDAQNAPGIKVALFGRVDARVSVAGELKGMRWGVFNTSNKEEHTFQADDPIARAFVYQAPGTNRPHMESVLDKNGKQVMKPASDHFAMTSYAKRFSPVLSRNIENHIQDVILHRVSLIDRNVLLSENDWAVTLVSSMDCTQNMLSRLFRGTFGHAMLACEGVEQDKPFIRYLHLTQSPKEKNPKLAKDEAQIESFDRTEPLETFNGPTWARSKVLVEKMFSFVDTMKNKPVKFAYYGSYFWQPIIAWAAFNQEILENKNAMIDTFNNFPDETRMPSTCLDWAYRVAEKCGIIFNGNRTLTKPMEKIKIVRASPVAFLPSGFDQTCLGRPFSGKNIELSAEILSSCVLITPNDCHPNDIERWANQWVIEDTAATDREIERMNNAKSLSELFSPGYTPKRW